MSIKKAPIRGQKKTFNISISKFLKKINLILLISIIYIGLIGVIANNPPTSQQWQGIHQIVFEGR
jgi:hypothetical protein